MGNAGSNPAAVTKFATGRYANPDAGRLIPANRPNGAAWEAALQTYLKGSFYTGSNPGSVAEASRFFMVTVAQTSAAKGARGMFAPFFYSDNMLKFGNICDIDAAAGLARVQFDDDGVTSAWLPIAFPNTLQNKYVWAFDVNEHVACLMDEEAENGVIVGAIYSKAEQPDDGDADKVRVLFSDGASVEYDRAASKLAVKVGTTELDVTEDGFTVKRGSETLKAILTDLIDAILAETHPTGTGPSGTPINAATYTAIKNRIPNLFE